MKTPNRSSGFTLIEVLASISVLLVLMGVMSQVVGVVGATWRMGKARIDAFSQARITLGMIDRDIQRIVLRPGLAAFTTASGSTSALAFYTRAQGSEGPREASLVQYRMEQVDQSAATGGNNLQHLVRCDYSMDFGELARTLTFGNPTNLPDLTQPEVRTREVAPGVLRLAWQFIDGAGVKSDRYSYDFDNPDAAANTRVVRVSLLVLDGSAYSLLIDSGSLDNLMSRTAGPPGPTETWAQYWDRLITSAALSPTLPRPVRQSLRVFERSIVIPVSK